VSEHRVSIAWQRESPDFTYESYNREHGVRFEGGVSLRASAAPEYGGQAGCPNPEEALVFALASCHMLTFLAIAAKRKWIVERYDDDAIGTLAKNEHGKLAVTEVVLRPRVTWGGQAPAHEAIVRAHEASHRECFIANSVRTEIRVELE